MSEQPASELRAQRERLGLSRDELAGRIGVPRDTLRRWEDGTRRPSEARLRRLLDALGAVEEDANAVLRSFDYPPNRTLWALDRFPGYYFKADELEEAAEAAPWPCFVANQNIEVVAANRLMQALWGVDLAEERRQRTDVQMNLLSVASDHRFIDRIANWAECLHTLVAIAKGQPRGAESLDEPTPYFREVLAAFADGDPVFLQSLFTAWTTTEPQPAKCRWSYPVVWKAHDGELMNFQAMVTVGSEPDNFGFNDWIPTDARTWTLLEDIKPIDPAARK